MQSNRNLVLVCVVAVLMLLTLWIWLALRPESLDSVAQKATLAVVNNKPKVLCQYFNSKELNLMNLTSGSFVEFWEEIAAPELRYWSLSGSIDIEDLGGNPWQAVATAHFVMGPGRAEFLSLSAHRGDRGPFIFASPLMISIWRLRYARIHPGPLSIADQRYAVLEGVRKDRSRLQGLGIKGLVSHDGNWAFKSWDEIEATQIEELNKLGKK